jgi:hypothetical protein
MSTLLSVWPYPYVPVIYQHLAQVLMHKKYQRTIHSQVLVAHTCNASYSGGRDQEDGSLKPAHTNSSGDPILKILNT